MSFPVLTVEGQSFAVAPYFCLEGDWSSWMQVADGAAWRAPRAGEIESWSRAGRRGTLTASACLFALPADRRAAFWSLLQVDGAGGFTDFAADVARYLAFKQLPPPEGAVFDLVACPPGTTAELGERVWAVANVSDAEAFAVRDRVRLRLRPGAGCRVAGEVIVWGAEGNEPGLLLVVRRPA